MIKIILMVLMVCGLVMGQVTSVPGSGGGIKIVGSDPTGAACTADQVVNYIGTIYTCQGGVFAVVAGAPGPPMDINALTEQLNPVAANDSVATYDALATALRKVKLVNLPFLLKANNLSDVANAATARTNLGLGALNDPTFRNLSLNSMIINSTADNGFSGIRPTVGSTATSPALGVQLGGTIKGAFTTDGSVFKEGIAATRALRYSAGGIIEGVPGDVANCVKADGTSSACVAEMYTAYVKAGDNTATIQAAIDSIPVTGGKVFVKAATYTLTSGLTVPSSKTDFELECESGTIFEWGLAGAAITFGDASGPMTRPMMKNCKVKIIDANANVAQGIRWIETRDGKMDEVSVLGPNGLANSRDQTGIWLDGGATPGHFSAKNMIIRPNVIGSFARGIHITGPTSDGNNNNTIIGGIVANTAISKVGSFGTWIQNGDTNTLFRVDYSDWGYGTKVGNDAPIEYSHLNIIQARYEGSTIKAVWIANGEANFVQGHINADMFQDDGYRTRPSLMTQGGGNTDFTRLYNLDVRDSFTVTHGNTLPPSCVNGNVFHKDDAVAGVNLYTCVSSAWVAQSRIYQGGPSGLVVIDPDAKTVDILTGPNQLAVKSAANDWTGRNNHTGPLKIRTYTGAPTVADCNEATEYNDVAVQSDGTTAQRVFVCTASGWEAQGGDITDYTTMPYWINVGESTNATTSGAVLASGSANLVRARRVVITRPISISKIMTRITVLSAGGKLGYGLYDINTGARIVQSGPLATDATGNIGATVTTTAIPKGVYWEAWGADNTTVATICLQQPSALTDVIYNLGATTAVYYTSDQTFSAASGMPATLGTLTRQAAAYNLPIVATVR